MPGDAVTAGHVVALAQHDPARYAPQAELNGELYAVTVDCASPMSPDQADGLIATARDRSMNETRDGKINRITK